MRTDSGSTGKRRNSEKRMVSVHKDVFSYERLVAASIMEVATFSRFGIVHFCAASAIASISLIAARSTSPAPVK